MNLSEIQKKIQSQGTEAYLVSYENRFIGQDILPHEHKIRHLCGFSGSAGALLVTAKTAYLFVDGRYELQARQEVDQKTVEVVDLVPQLSEVCAFAAQKGIKHIGYDAWCYSAAEINSVKRINPKCVLQDVGDWVEIENSQKVDVLHRDDRYSGMPAAEKLNMLARQIKEFRADYYLITAADSVSWLLNIYARDLPYSPVVRAWTLVNSEGKATLIGDNLRSDLPVMSFAELMQWLQQSDNSVILVNESSMPQKIKEQLPPNTLSIPDICARCKAIKNRTELEGMKKCHERDGVALVKLLYWLENNWQNKTELDVVQKLHDLRKRQDLFFSESFATIAGAAENGAIVHYQPTVQSNRQLKENNLLLLDSGAQYLDGTTDVTRTVVLGKPTADMKDHFTYVLKAHISLAQAVFPLYTMGSSLDVLARSPLWRHGLDYKHGTGHGVACFGNVHEGLVSISAHPSSSGFASSMVTSIEPGYYKANAYGIRIENLAYTTEAENISNFLIFTPLTLVPIDKRLINKYLLDQGERDWLNNYHRMVYERLAGYVDEQEKKWLEKSCSPL